MLVGSAVLTRRGRVTHFCISKLAIIGSDNGLSPGRRQAIIWTIDLLLLIKPLGINFSNILIETNTFSFKKMLLKMSSGKRCSFCLGLNVLTYFDPTSLGTTDHPVALKQPLQNGQLLMCELISSIFMETSEWAGRTLYTKLKRLWLVSYKGFHTGPIINKVICLYIHPNIWTNYNIGWK